MSARSTVSQILCKHAKWLKMHPETSLVPLMDEHLDAMRTWLNNPTVAEGFLFDRHIQECEHSRWFQEITRSEDQFVYAILDDVGRHVGIVGFKNIDRNSATAEFFVYVDPDHQRKGIGRMATRKALAVAFFQHGLRRLNLHVRSDNLAAVRIYLSLGFENTSAPVTGFSRRFLDTLVQPMHIDLRDAEDVITGRPKVALMQPMFLPWLGYFELLDSVDLFVVLDDFQFTRQSWAQRNRFFFGANTPSLVSLPINHPGNLDATFLEMRDARTPHWRKKFLTSVSQAYGRTPMYGSVMPLLETWLATEYQNLGQFLMAWVRKLAAHLGIKTEITESSKLNLKDSARSWRLNAILDGYGAGSYYSAYGSFGYMEEDGVFQASPRKVFFQNHKPRHYKQIRPGFSPFLSALDAAFMLDPVEFRGAMRGTRRWLDWESRASLHRRDSASSVNADLPES